MSQVLSKDARVKVGDTWMKLEAVLTRTHGGKRVVYIDKNGKEVHSEPLSKSQFAPPRKRNTAKKENS
ncbi:MAG: hypothetical protein FWB92_02805 [Oscillospiraceae bacterium]|nr:hypothetical protein [Oscillospiraceae bacterium]